MKLLSIGFKNFRNLKESNVDTNAKVVVAEGRNGAGKTSFLECIYSSLLLSSFKCRKLTDSILYNSQYCQMRSVVNKGPEILNVHTYYDRQKRIIKVNNNKLSGYSELLNLFSVVILSYNDKDIITTGPELRRKYINQTLCFTNIEYAEALKKYSILLKNRNQAIKEKKYDIVEILDEKICHVGYIIFKERKKITKELEIYVNNIYSEIFNIEPRFTISDKSNCEKITSEQDYLSSLKQSLKGDIILECTSIGPHRDDFIFSFDGHTVKDNLSTGQIRLLSIVLKFALINLIKDKTSFSPIILVDDVLLELEEEKKKIVFRYLTHYRQTFYTFLPQEKFYNDFCDDILIYNIDDGRIRKV